MDNLTIIINKNGRLIEEDIQVGKTISKSCNSRNIIVFFKKEWMPLPFIQKTLPGKGFHSGCSFPMSKKPKKDKNESDLLGRVGGFQNIYVVDSTIFPEIKSTTITLAVMANAYRIANESLLREQLKKWLLQ